MMDLNKIELIGRLTADPDARGSEKEVKCVSLRMATNRDARDASGKVHQQTEFHSVVMFGKLATVAEKYLKQGDRLFVDGRIQTNAWVSQDGSRKSKTEIIAENLIMLGGKPKSEKCSRNDEVVVEEIDTDERGEG